MSAVRVSFTCCNERCGTERREDGGGCLRSGPGLVVMGRCCEWNEFQIANRGLRIDPMQRVIEPEWLDELRPENPRALHSRRDLRRINWLMGHVGIMQMALMELER